MARKPKRKQTNYQIGYYLERKVAAALEARGYFTMTSRGSHGPFDVAGWRFENTCYFGAPQDGVLIQVKANGWPCQEERTAMLSVKLAGDIAREVWRYDRKGKGKRWKGPRIWRVIDGRFEDVTEKDHV